MVALTYALDGLARSQSQLNQAAFEIARAPAALPGGDSVDLSSAAVALLQARNSFDANTKVIKIADQLDKILLDMVGESRAKLLNQRARVPREVQQDRREDA